MSGQPKTGPKLTCSERCQDSRAEDCQKLCSDDKDHNGGHTHEEPGGGHYWANRELVEAFENMSTAGIEGHDNTIPGWEEKLKLAEKVDGGEGFKPFHFVLQGYVDDLAKHGVVLDEYQQSRLWRRMMAIQMIANRMATNMLKGVLKYKNQERSQDHWREMGFDDLIDAINYAGIERWEADNPIHGEQA